MHIKPRIMSCNTKGFVHILIIAAAFQLSTGKELHLNGSPDGRSLDPSRLPINMVVMENQEVVLTCAVRDHSIQHGVEWYEYTESEQGTIISHNEFLGDHPRKDRYAILTNDAGLYSLRIRPVQMMDGGRYRCVNTYAGGQEKFQHSAVLTVLASAPICNTTLPENGDVLDNGYHTNECSLEYQGLIPNITWSGIGPFNWIYTVTPTHVYSGMEYNVTRNMNNRSHICDTFFVPYFHPVDEDTADNVPGYTSTHRERVMHVFWSPTNMSHTPGKPYYEVGDTLTCYSDSNPTASYMWQNMRSLQQVQGNTISLPEDWLGFNQTLRCEARNVISGFLFTNNYYTPVDMPVPTTPTTPTTTLASTLPPAVSECLDLTGAWESYSPGRASLCIKLDLDNNGMLQGLARNHTDTFFVDVVGRSTSASFSQVAFAGIWPLEFGVSTFVGECHRCFGIERILAHVTNRIRGGECGVAGPHAHTIEYEFYRSTNLRCPTF